MEVWTPFFLLIALAVGTFAAPTETCAKQCETVYNSKFKYDVGKAYSYNYEASSIIGVDGGATEVPGVKLKAVAEIHAITPCEFSLKLTNVNFQGNENPNPPQAGDLKKGLEAQTLGFSFTDGRIDHVCPHNKDAAYIVNIKRAVLSAFQNSMDKGLESHVREADIVGLCDTHYKAGTKPGEIIKTKDIHSCTNRQGNFTSIQAKHYDSTSHFQTPPVVAPSHKCIHVVADGIIKSVSCEEVQHFKLYSKGDKGTYTETKTKLTYTKTGKSNAKAAKGADHESLFFDHSEDYDAKSNKPETEKVLKEICANSEDGDVDANSADLFTRLVYLVRRLPLADIRTLLASTKNCKSPQAKDTFVGALLSAGSEPSLRVLVEILKKGEISKLRSRLWHFSLAFNARPTTGTIDAITPLIEGEVQSKTALLGVSSHVWGYCRIHTDCEKEKSVQKVLDILGKNLGKNCKSKDNAEEDKIVAVLKAFGNIGHVGKYENTILTCAKDSTLFTTTRLAAIEAFRRHAADDTVITTLTHLLEDHKENAEVRIASYLSLIKRADSKIANKIEEILNNEEIDQVTSFIWSHVKNLQETESPLRQIAKHLAQSIHFNQKYISDPRKYSRNYEASFFNDKYNLGGNVDSNVIFSPDSFLPRSGMVNLTVDIFGSSLNLLEVDVRAENFESLLEAYFGPNGKFLQQTPLELANEFRQRWRSIAQGIENEVAEHDHDHSKHKRDLIYSSQKLREKRAKAPSGTPHGSFAVKIFGNELTWRNFHNLDEVYDKSDPYNLQDIFNALAKHKEYDLARNWMFVDTTFTIPTASGFPVKWDLNGSLSAGLKLNSHFDIRELFLRPRRCDIKSLIQPSVNIQWGGAITIDAHIGKVGFKLVSDVYSSIAFDGTLKLNEGELLHVKLGLPKERSTLLHYDADLYVIKGDVETRATQKFPERYNIKECSDDYSTLNIFPSLDFCTSISLPKPLINLERPFIPLGGRVEYDFTLIKKDPGLQGVEFIASLHQDKDGNGDVSKTEAKISFNTPGSSADREYTIDYKLDRNDKTLKVEVKSPKRKISLDGNYVDGENQKEGKLTLNYNNEEVYSFSGKASVKKAGDKIIYSPVWEFTRANSKTVVKGTVTRTVGKKIEFDLKSDSSSDKKVQIKGFAQRDGPLDFGKNFKADTDLTIVLPFIEGKIAGTFKNGEDDGEETHDLDLKGEYNLPGGDKRSGTLKLHRETKIKDGEIKFKRLIEWTTGRFPEYNFHANALIENINNQYHSFLEAKWGKDFEDPNHKLFYERTYKIKKSGKAIEGEGKIRFLYPRRNIDWDINSKLKLQPKKQANYDLDVKYSGGKTLKLHAEFKNESSSLDHYKYEISLDYPGRQIVLRHDFEEKSPKVYKGDLYFQWQKGEHVKLASQYKDKCGPGVVYLEGEIVVTLYDSPKPIRKYNALINIEKGKIILLGKVERPDKIYLVDINYEYPAPYTANAKIDVKLPWIEGKLNSKRTPGEFDGSLDFTTEKRRVVGDAKLKGDTHKVLTANLKWDAGRDESKKIALKANIERPRVRAANVKGTLDTPNYNFKGEIKYELPYELFNGQHNVFFDIEYAPEKKVTVDAKINVDKSNADRRLSHGEIKVNTPSIQNLKIAYNTDFHKLPDQRSFKADVNVDSTRLGNIIVKIDHLRGDRKIDSGFDVTYGEGKTIGAGIGVYFDVGRGLGFDVGGSLKLKTPLDGFKDFEITIREGFKRSSEYAHIIHDNHLRWGPDKEIGAAFEWTRKYDAGKGFEVGVRLQVDTPNPDFRHQKIQAEVEFQKDPIHVRSNFDAIWGADKRLKYLVFYKREGGKIEGHFVADGRVFRPQGYVEVLYNRNPIGTDKYSSHGSVKYAEIVVTFVNKGYWSPEKKSADLTITIPELFFPSKVVNVKGNLIVKGIQRNGDVIVTWGDKKDNSVNAHGDWTVGENDHITGKITIDPSKLGIDKITADIDSRIGGPKRSYNTKLILGPERIFDIGLTVDDKSDHSGKTAVGSLKINNEDFISVEVDLVDAKTKKNAFGRLLSFTATLNNPLLSFTSEAVLFSEQGLHPSAKICTIDKAKCIAFSSLLDLHHLDPKLGLIDNNVHVKFTAQRGPGDSRTIGFVFRTAQVRNKYEHFFKWLISEEQKKYVGYSYTKELSFDKNKPGSNKVYQILLPSRTLEAKSDKVYSKDGYTYNLHLLLDAVRQPKEELLVNVVVKNSTAGGIYTRNSRVTIKHPKFTKDLTVTNLLKIGEEKVLYSQKTELDLSSDPKKKITIDVELSDQPSAKYPRSHNYSFSWTIRQQTIKNLNGRISGNLVRGPEARITNVEFYWLTKSGTAKVYTLHSELDKIADTIEGSLKTPYREFSWDGAYRHFEDSGAPTINAHVDLKYNGKLFRRAALDYSRGPEYNIKYYVDPADTSRLFRLHGGVVEDDTYSWTATRVRDGQETQDLDIYLHLNNSNLLYNRYNWRVGLLQDVREGLEARVDKIGDDVQKALQNVAENFKEEVVNKVQLIRDTLKTDLIPLGKYARTKLQTSLSEFEDEVKKTNFDRLKDVLGAIFGGFFDLKEINGRVDAFHDNLVARVVGLRTKISELSERLVTKLNTIEDDIAAALGDLPSKIQQFRTNLKAKIPEIGEKIRAALAKIREAITNIIENQQISKGLHQIQEIYEGSVTKIKESLARVTESLIGPGDGKTSLYERIRTKLWEYAEGDGQLAKVLKGVLTAIKSLKEKACELIEDAKEFLKAARQAILERLSTVAKKLEENPEFQALLNEVAVYRQQFKDKYLQGDLSTKEGIRKALDKVLTHTRERIEKLTGAAVFDLKNGHIEFYVPLVVPIDSIRSVRESLNIRQLWFELSNRSPSFSLLEAYQRAKPYFARGRRDLLPPYNAQAMLIGNQHFMTFDKRFYDFAGKCQYVLTRDFYDANFTVILNYDAIKETPTKISFIVISDSHHVEIKPDSTVILDQQEVELPIQIETTVIQRHWNIIRVENSGGFTFTYDVAYDVATVNISGWYFGRVAGLFGNNDNEPDNDLENTQGNVTSSIAQFANNWEVSYHCSSAENHALDKQAGDTTNIYNICNQLLHSDRSTFGQCLQYVKPDDFFKICLQEGIQEEDYTNGICRAVAGYKYACAYHGVNLQMPPKCVRCKTPQSSVFVEGEIKVLKGDEIPKSADVVFIMEQKECNRRVLLESLDEVAEELDKGLLANGFDNNRYGIVGFGGDGSQQIPHSHTARGQIFTDAASVIWALKNMAFSSLTVPSDTLGAIKLAADYPFRTGVAKICILYLCKRCSESGMTVDYHTLRSHLLHQGISLHILTPSEIHVKTKSQLTDRIIGIDAYTTYSAKDINQDKLSGDSHLRSFVTGIKDNCFTLAQELNGCIFRSDLIGVRKLNLGKSVKSIFVRRLLESSKPSNCQTCTCAPDADGVGQPSCKPCDLPTLQLVKPDVGDHR